MGLRLEPLTGDWLADLFVAGEMENEDFESMKAEAEEETRTRRRNQALQGF